MKVEIIGYEKQVLPMEVMDEKTKKVEVVNQPIAVITLRSDIPKNLPVGQMVEVKVVKEEKKE